MYILRGIYNLTNGDFPRWNFGIMIFLSKRYGSETVMKGTPLLCITAVLALLLAGCGNGDAAVSAGADDNTPAVTAPLPAGGENSSAETQLPVSDAEESAVSEAEEAVQEAVPEPAPKPSGQPLTQDASITLGTIEERGFVVDNVLHSQQNGDIHFSSYVPAEYDGSTPYALFITLPGWEGLYFQGVGANLQEDYGDMAQEYVSDMIVLSPQLSDWGDTSANQTIALTEYFLEHYNIDPDRVYLEGLSGGGETGSLVICKRPELYTAYLSVSTQWDGELAVLAAARTPVYMVIGENDSYYGSGSLKAAYAQLRSLYEEQGLSEDEINRLVQLDVKPQEYFTQRGFSDQHAGSAAFSHDETVMGWLFGSHDGV